MNERTYGLLFMVLAILALVLALPLLAITTAVAALSSHTAGWTFLPWAAAALLYGLNAATAIWIGNGLRRGQHGLLAFARLNLVLALLLQAAVVTFGFRPSLLALAFVGSPINTVYVLTMLVLSWNLGPAAPAAAPRQGRLIALGVSGLVSSVLGFLFGAVLAAEVTFVFESVRLFTQQGVAARDLFRMFAVIAVIPLIGWVLILFPIIAGVVVISRGRTSEAKVLGALGVAGGGIDLLIVGGLWTMQALFVNHALG